MSASSSSRNSAGSSLSAPRSSVSTHEAVIEPEFIPFRNDEEPGLSASTRTRSLDSQFSSYVEYLQHLQKITDQNPCVDWLLKFFNTLPDYNEPDEPPTECLVADMLDQGWRLARQITKEVLDQTIGVSARVVVIECKSLLWAWVDRDVLDTVAHYYALNPTQLWDPLFHNKTHYCYNDDYYGALGLPPSDGNFSVPVIDPTDADIVRLAHTTGQNEDNPRGELRQHSIFGFLLGGTSDGIPTCLIFSTSPAERYIASLGTGYLLETYHPLGPEEQLPRPTSLIEVFVGMLSNLRSAERRALAETPTKFLLIYLQLSLRVVSQRVGVISTIIANWSLNDPGTIIEELCNLKITISQVLRNVKDLTHKHGVADSPQATALMAELRRLEATLPELTASLVYSSQVNGVSASLMESRKAIQMTDSVKLLTQLAFIFIPLTFSASIFGMNFKELGSGPLSITTFIATAGAVTGTTLATFLITRALTGNRRKLVTFALSLFLYLPWEGFLLLVFLIFGELKVFSGILHDRSPTDRLLQNFRSDFSLAFYASELTDSAFWQAWLLPFEKFADACEPGWKDLYAWQRWSRDCGDLIRSTRARLGRWKGQADDGSDNSERDGAESIA